MPLRNRCDIAVVVDGHANVALGVKVQAVLICAARAFGGNAFRASGAAKNQAGVERASILRGRISINRVRGADRAIHSQARAAGDEAHAAGGADGKLVVGGGTEVRSEEHTAELQS